MPARGVGLVPPPALRAITSNAPTRIQRAPTTTSQLNLERRNSVWYWRDDTTARRKEPCGGLPLGHPANVNA
eukprot:596440-Lingulodinium_polyedra.AAC.1